MWREAWVKGKVASVCRAPRTPRGIDLPSSLGTRLNFNVIISLLRSFHPILLMSTENLSLGGPVEDRRNHKKLQETQRKFALLFFLIVAEMLHPKTRAATQK